MKLLIHLIFLLFSINNIFSQDEVSFCRAVQKENFKKVESIVKREIKKRKNGIEYDNGPGSGKQINHINSIDSITTWLKKMSCVADAASDKCEIKIAIYPGWLVIGAIFKTNNGNIEKCFRIQQGTTGTVNIFGWKPRLSKMKNKLVYKKMYDCPGFVKQQQKKCNDFK